MDDELGAEPGVGLRTGGRDRRHRAHLPSDPDPQLQIYPGLDVGNAQRNLQPLPKVLGLSFDTDPCQPITLTNQPGRQDIKVDSKKQVTQLRIGIGSAYPAANAAPFISITEVVLKSFPS